MSRVDHWASVRDRTYSVAPVAPIPQRHAKPKIVPINRHQAVEMARAFLAALPERPRIADIQSLVCTYFDRTMAELTGDSRRAENVYPRHVAMYLAHKFTGHSLKAIGRAFGNRDHTTVLHATRKIEAMLLDFPEKEQPCQSSNCEELAYHGA